LTKTPKFTILKEESAQSIAQIAENLFTTGDPELLLIGYPLPDIIGRMA
jgi:hypothetical protein